MRGVGADRLPEVRALPDDAGRLPELRLRLSATMSSCFRLERRR
jgi:hypothetical protein